MVNKILTGITSAIGKTFGDGYRIYTDHVEQGLQEPCFFCACINQKDERWLGNRRKQTNQFSIQYFPSSDEPKVECNAISERLVCALEYIQIGNECLEGTNMQSTITDDVLTLTVNYNLFAYRKVADETKMDDINLEGGLK